MATIDQTQANLSSHEAVCALRYDSICARIKRLEQILITTAGFIIVTLLAIVIKIN